jgi:hypothetical protein
VIQVNLGKAYRDLGNSSSPAPPSGARSCSTPPARPPTTTSATSTSASNDCAGAEYELSQAVSLAPNSLSPCRSWRSCSSSAATSGVDPALRAGADARRGRLRTAAVHLPVARLPQPRAARGRRPARPAGRPAAPGVGDAHYHLGRAYAPATLPATPTSPAARSSARWSCSPACRPPARPCAACAEPAAPPPRSAGGPRRAAPRRSVSCYIREVCRAAAGRPPATRCARSATRANGGSPRR